MLAERRLARDAEQEDTAEEPVGALGVAAPEDDEREELIEEPEDVAEPPPETAETPPPALNRRSPRTTRRATTTRARSRAPLQAGPPESMEADTGEPAASGVDSAGAEPEPAERRRGRVRSRGGRRCACQNPRARRPRARGGDRSAAPSHRRPGA